MIGKRYVVVSEKGDSFQKIWDNTFIRFIDVEEVADKLNNNEKRRIRDKKLIEEYKKREEKFQDIITGLMAFIELRVKEEIWSEWND